MRKLVLFLGLVLLALTTVASAATVVEITDDTTTSFYGYGTLADESEGLGLLKATDWYQAVGGEDRLIVDSTFSDGEFVVGTGSEGTGAFSNARVLGMYGAYTGALTVYNSTFSDNSVTSARASETTAGELNIVGGLLYGGSMLAIEGATLTNNTAAATGTNGLVTGAVAASYYGQPLILNNVTVAGNSATGARVQGVIAAVSGNDTDVTIRMFRVTRQ